MPPKIESNIMIRGTRSGKTFETAKMVEGELSRGTAVWMQSDRRGWARVVDVDFGPEDMTDAERAAFKRHAARLEQSIRDQKNEFVSRSLMGAVTYTDVQALPAPKLEEIIAGISEAMKAFGSQPPEFDVFPSYRPRMTIDPEPWKDRLAMYLHSYPLFAPMNPQMFMNVGDFGEPYQPARWRWIPPDPAERALALLAARPLDRRRIKRCLRIMGLRHG